MKFKKVIVAAALGLSINTANAGVIDLGFLLDRSGSIGSTNWTTMTSGFANALDNLSLDSRYRVTFVGFDSNAFTMVAPTLIDSQTTLDTVKNTVATYSYLGGWTNTGGAFNQLMDEWSGFDLSMGSQLINIATDGNPRCSSLTTCGNSTTIAASKAYALAEATVALEAGVDSISAEAIGNGIDTNFLLELISPDGALYQTGDPLPDPLVSGFVVEVESFAEFNSAIDSKLQNIVISTTPEPSVLALMAFGLAGLGFARRHRQS